MIRVQVRPELLRWAREHAGLTTRSLKRRFARLERWERGEARPTLKQLEGLTKATRRPVGHLFFPEPPIERVPIPDFRTMGNALLGHPRPDLRESVKNQWLG